MRATMASDGRARVTAGSTRWDEERLVEAEGVAKPRHGLGSGVLTQHEGDGVAGNELDRQRHHEDHTEQDGHGEEQPPHDEGQHGRGPGIMTLNALLVEPDLSE